MTDIIAVIILAASTAALIGLIRLIIGSAAHGCKKPEASLRIYYDERCECLEYILGQILRSRAVSELDLRLTVVDTVNTPESEEYLIALRRRLNADFTVESGGEGHFGGENNNKRDR